MSDKIPGLAQDLLKKIFVRYPQDRISIEEIKQHEFFKGKIYIIKVFNLINFIYRKSLDKLYLKD